MFSNLQIKLPSLGGDVKSERGLVVAEPSIIGYEIAIDPSLLFNDYHAVKPGAETTLDVSIDELPTNANITRLSATLFVANADGSPDKDTTGVSITKNGKSDDPASGSFSVAVDQGQRPRNLQLKLAGGDQVWSFGAALSASTYALPDFSHQLNAYLDHLHASAPITKLGFVCKSDAPGKVGLRIDQMEYSQVKTQSWQNPLDHTTRVDRTVTLAFGAIEQLPQLDALTSRSDARVQLLSIKLDVSGQFGPERLLGDVESHDGHMFATISSDYALAHAMTLSANLIKAPRRCTGVNAFFVADDKAEVYLELQPDANGYPASAAPLAKANVSYVPPDPKDSRPPAWTFAKFAAPAELKPGVRYWIVVKGVRGVGRLGLQQLSGAPDPSTTPALRDVLLMSRGGMIWKALMGPAATSRVVALLGLVYVPGPDDQTAAIEIVIDGEPLPQPIHQAVEPERAPHTVQLDGGGRNWNTANVQLHSHAQGSCTVANVIREYQLK